MNNKTINELFDETKQKMNGHTMLFYFHMSNLCITADPMALLSATIKIEGNDWTKALDQAFARKQKTVKVDGFRAGKVPRDIFEKKFTRIPVYEGTTDNVIGTINMKDLLLYDNTKILHKKILEIITLL